MTQHRKPPEFRDSMPFLGGAAWIDLLNSTLKPEGTVIDFLDGNSSLAAWLAHAGLPAGISLGAERAALIDLRDALRPVFEDLAAGYPLAPALLLYLNTLLARSRTVHRLETDGARGYRLAATATIEPPVAVVAIAEELARFLLDYEPARLKHCDNPRCSMVFYDRGKNNRRRWCSSAVCGNRDKVANYRARKSGRLNGALP